MPIDLVELIDRVWRLDLLLVKEAEVLLVSVEVEGCDRLAVVVIEEDGEVAPRIVEMKGMTKAFFVASFVPIAEA